MPFHVWKDLTWLSVVGANIYCMSQHFFLILFEIQMLTNCNPPEEKNPLALFPLVIDFYQGLKEKLLMLLCTVAVELCPSAAAWFGFSLKIATVATPGIPVRPFFFLLINKKKKVQCIS